MTNPERYLRTGRYRTHQDEVTSFAEGAATETLERMEENKVVFGVPLESLTEDERADITAFTAYASERLAAGALYSPIAAHDVQHNLVTQGIRKVQNRGKRGGGIHDVIHAAVAYTTNDGESLVPAYARLENATQQETDLRCFQEELTVFLLEGVDSVDSWLNPLLEPSIDLDKVWNEFAQPYPPDNPPGELMRRKGLFRQLCNEIEPLKDSDPIEYRVRILEFFFLAEAAIADSARKEYDLPDRFQDVPSHQPADPDPEYKRIFAHLYENAQQEQPDPKIHLQEFRRIISPLLKRIRPAS